MERYSFDPVTNTLTISANFAKALKNTDSAEYALLTTIRSDFPGLAVRRMTHKTPTKYRTKSEGEYSCHPNKHLSYKNMEGFMGAIKDGEKYLAVYDFLKKSASKLNTSPYAAIRRWFVAQFPDYRNNSVFYLDNSVDVITDVSPFLPKGEASGDAA